MTSEWFLKPIKINTKIMFEKEKRTDFGTPAIPIYTGILILNLKAHTRNTMV